MKNLSESEIIALHPAPVGWRLAVLSVWDIDGWFSGWREPAIMVALVERRYYDRDVDTVPGNPLTRQTHVTATERQIEPVICDVNSLTGLSTWSDLQDMVSDNERLHVIHDDIDWEELIRLVADAARHFAWCARRASGAGR
jgi:hypothetical protein